MGGLSFGFFGGQPLVIIMTTAPLCLYIKGLWGFFIFWLKLLSTNMILIAIGFFFSPKNSNLWNKRRVWFKLSCNVRLCRSLEYFFSHFLRRVRRQSSDEMVHSVDWGNFCPFYKHRFCCRCSERHVQKWVSIQCLSFLPGRRRRHFITEFCIIHTVYIIYTICTTVSFNLIFLFLNFKLRFQQTLLFASLFK